MADQIEINIYMHDGGGQVTGAEDITGAGSNLANISNSGNTSAGGTQNNVVNTSGLGKYVASQTISVFMANTKSAISQNIGLVTGKTELQERVNFGMSIAQTGVNIFKNAVVYGMAFGPAGAIAGAVGTIMGDVINNAFKQQQINIKRELENVQIQQIRTRAGAGFNRSREGN